MSISRRIPLDWTPPAAAMIASLLIIAWASSGCVVISQNMRLPPRMSGPPVPVRQFCTPTQKLPARVRTLAVAAFGGATKRDRLWARATALATSKAITDNLRDFPRHGIVLRGGADDLLGAPPAGEASTATAADLGRRAGVDAVITGNVAVGNQHGRPALAVQFALVRSGDGLVLDRWEHHGRFNPTANSSPNRGGGDTVALHDLLSETSNRRPRQAGATPLPRNILPRTAGRLYAHRITPHWRVLRVPLANGGGEYGDAGRRAAAAGNSREALLNFRRVARRDGRDPGAWYNVGVLYESRGEWQQARDAYRTAVNIYDIVPFRRGLQRTTRELTRLAETTISKD